MVRDPGVLPSGVVTFVLTDVVDSTRIWENAPGTMDESMHRCESLIGGAVAWLRRRAPEVPR